MLRLAHAQITLGTQRIAISSPTRMKANLRRSSKG
jgi:hypothetical protein